MNLKLILGLCIFMYGCTAPEKQKSELISESVTIRLDSILILFDPVVSKDRSVLELISKNDKNMVPVLDEIIENEQNEKKIYNGRFLKLNEPDLKNKDLKYEEESYRLIIKRAFNPEAILIRVEKLGGNLNIVTKTFTDSCNIHLGITEDCLTVLKSNSKSISEEEWNRFKKKLESSEFWEIDELDGREYIDGSMWILEAKRGRDNYNRIAKTYKKVIRQSPKEYMAVYEVGQHLIKLSGNDFGEIY